MEATAESLQLQTVHFDPGDVLVVRSRAEINDAQAASIRGRIEAKLPAGVTVLVLGPGAEIAKWSFSQKEGSAMEHTVTAEEAALNLAHAQDIAERVSRGENVDRDELTQAPATEPPAVDASQDSPATPPDEG